MLGNIINIIFIGLIVKFLFKLDSATTKKSSSNNQRSVNSSNVGSGNNWMF